MSPWFSLIAALLGAGVGSAAASHLTRARDRDAAIRKAVADYITASVEVVRLVWEARRNRANMDTVRFDELNEQTTRTEQALWLLFEDADLVIAAREVSAATSNVLVRWGNGDSTDAAFTAARVRARDAQVALFEQARRKVNGAKEAGLPPHLSYVPTDQ